MIFRITLNQILKINLITNIFNNDLFYLHEIKTYIKQK